MGACIGSSLGRSLWRGEYTVSVLAVGVWGEGEGGGGCYECTNMIFSDVCTCIHS